MKFANGADAHDRQHGGNPGTCLKVRSARGRSLVPRDPAYAVFPQYEKRECRNML